VARLDLSQVPGRVSGRQDLTLFGEAPTRVVVSVALEQVERLRSRLQSLGVPSVRLGSVGGEALSLEIGGEELEVSLPALADAYQRGIPRALEESPGSGSIDK